ncbi:hypothetical protein [Burkholderia lata]|uniref:hypothetical protein n=1 Tax=Burkholderia lata (strain ATCC 17760 / DSM 23089 / LMG 22485 / NCIMB 9086 / R18194 / 383) TaxID=482957 RepID=UPI001581CD97|nr:hypothetical protein [Burkholderia lata]
MDADIRTDRSQNQAGVSERRKRYAYAITLQNRKHTLFQFTNGRGHENENSSPTIGSTVVAPNSHPDNIMPN